MNVTVTNLRSELASWVDTARNGAEIIITDRGEPVARLVPLESASLLDRLTDAGVLSAPASTERPSARRTKRVTARGPVAELVGEQRR